MKNQVPNEPEHRHNYVKVRSFGQMLDVMMRAGQWDRHHSSADNDFEGTIEYQGQSESNPERSCQIIQAVKRIERKASEQHLACMLAVYDNDSHQETAKLLGVSNSRVSQLMNKVKEISDSCL